MHVLSLVLAGVTACMAGGIGEDGSIILARRALNGTTSPAVMDVTDTEVPAWGAPRWEEAHAGDAGMLSAGQKLSTQTYAAEDRDSMMHVEPTGHVAPPAEEAEVSKKSTQQQPQHHVPKGPDFSWMWSVDGALAVGMVIVTTGLVFTAAG